MDSLEVDIANKERTRLRLFQFSLRDQASNWIERLPVGSISTWEDLTTRFLAQFFPPRRTTKLRNDILMFQQHQGESLSESASGKLRDRNAEESWALLEDLALYDNKSWNDPKDFAKPVKAISLPQDVSSTFDIHLIELENQVQHLMEAHLAPKQLVQVNKITSLCEICSGPHDAQYCMEHPEQAFVDYVSSHNNEVGGRQFTTKLRPRNFKEAINAWKDKPNFNWERTQSFTSPQKGLFSTYSSSYQATLERTLSEFDSYQERRLSSLEAQLEWQQDDMINKINILPKVFSEKLNDTSTRDTTGDIMAHVNVASTNQIEKEELRRKGIKSPYKLLSLKYLSQTSLEEQNRNPSSLKRVHFIKSVVIIRKEDEVREKENVNSNATEYNDHEMTAKAEENVEEESKNEFEEEIEEEEEEEEEEEDVEYFDTFPCLEELRYHE
ncbi:MAK10-like protein [Tanacetum coccineum]